MAERLIMTKIGRNEPCPCGSGKKYKKCCLLKTASVNNAPPMPAMTLAELYDDLEALDSLSNSVIGLIENGQIDKAEDACQELLRRYPDQVDGLHRLAEVYKARGDTAKAIEYYEKTKSFMKTHEGFDSESLSWVDEKIQKLKTGQVTSKKD